MKLKVIFLTIGLFVISLTTNASFLPPNDLYLQDNINKAANMTKAEFNAVLDGIEEYFKPYVATHGATLEVENLWTDSTVNAETDRSTDDKTWWVKIYGGIARRKEVTKDGLALILCHEIGHQISGYPLKYSEWSATEGQSDYWATQGCAQAMWRNDSDINAGYRAVVPTYVKERCDKVWASEAEQNLCYRVAIAGQSLGNLMAALRDKPEPFPLFETPDPKEVPITRTYHSRAQCRLDTYFAGALCPVAFDFTVIPGRNHPSGQDTAAAETVAAKYSCMTSDGYVLGVRPRCWFKSRIN